MNFLEIANYVIDQQDGDRLGTIYNEDLGTLAQETRRLRDNINRALTLVKLALGWRNESAETTFTLTTTAGQEWVTFPLGITSISMIQFANDPPLKIVPWTEFERFKADTLLYTDTGSPDRCAIYGGKVYLYPTPDSVYTLNGRGMQSLSRLDEDDDSPDLPSELHQAVADFALYFEMAYENNPGAGLLLVQENGNMTAQGGQAAHALLMFRMARKTMRSHLEEPPRMIGGWETERLTFLRQVLRG